MKVNIGILKNELSKYLQKVRQGLEITVTDRNEPVAKLSPLQRPVVRVDVSDWLKKHPPIKTVRSQPSSTELLRKLRETE